MLTLAGNVQTLDTVITTYKTRFDSGGVLNECELEWEKGTKKEERQCEMTKEKTERFLSRDKKNSKKRRPVGKIRNTGKEFLSHFE